MTVQFNSVIIRIPGVEKSQDAFVKLCDVLDSAGFEFETYTYTPEFDSGECGETRKTHELLPYVILSQRSKP